MSPTDCLLPGTLSTQSEVYRFAVSHYSKAISSLRQLLSMNSSNHTVALITSVIFVAIEMLQGDNVTASAQIIGAFGLATDVLKGQKGLRKSPIALDRIWFRSLFRSRTNQNFLYSTQDKLSLMRYRRCCPCFKTYPFQKSPTHSKHYGKERSGWFSSSIILVRNALNVQQVWKIEMQQQIDIAVFCNNGKMHSHRLCQISTQLLQYSQRKTPKTFHKNCYWRVRMH